MKDARISTGIRGLDEVLEGGFMPSSSYLIVGGPGTGKTILSLQFMSGRPDGNSKSLKRI